jgi:N-acetylglucosamine-6-phosphate deacetylase
LLFSQAYFFIQVNNTSPGNFALWYSTCVHNLLQSIYFWGVMAIASLLLLKGGQAVIQQQLIANQGILIDQGRIIAVGNQALSLSAPRACQILDTTDFIVVPGFIDVHVHGGQGYDAQDATTDAIQQIASFHLRHGTTALLPTVAAGPPAVMEAVLLAIKNYQKQPPHSGAGVLGAHFEGPFLNPLQAGAQNPLYLRKPNLTEVRRWFQVGGNTLRLITLAPELPGITSLMPLFKANKVIVAAGHSVATYQEIKTAVNSGLKHITHTFNATGVFHQREPGIIGAALSLPELSTEIIADGRHVHPALIKILYQCKKQKMMLVTDAIRGAGMSDGQYYFADQPVFIKKGSAYLLNGTLAGSTLTMDAAVRYIVRQVGFSLPQAIALASTNPARLLGLQHCKGTIAPGMDADLVLLNSRLVPRIVLVAGSIRYP